jgi:hypothetical protein
VNTQKSYGTILTEETFKRIDLRMTSGGYDLAQEQTARAVLLAFIGRVRERAKKIKAETAWLHNSAYPLRDAFNDLASEIEKEGK